MRILQRSYRRHSTLFVFGTYAHRSWPQGFDDRRSGRRRWNLASCATGRHRRAGISVRVLHARLHHDRGRIFENESQSHAPPVGARSFGKSLPLSGLRQDSDSVDARRGKYAEVFAWIMISNSPIAKKITKNLLTLPSPRSASTADPGDRKS